MLKSLMLLQNLAEEMLDEIETAKAIEYMRAADKIAERCERAAECLTKSTQNVQKKEVPPCAAE